MSIYRLTTEGYDGVFKKLYLNFGHVLWSFANSKFLEDILKPDPEPIKLFHVSLPGFNPFFAFLVSLCIHAPFRIIDDRVFDLV